MRKIITGTILLGRYEINHIVKSSLLNPFTINYLHLANDSSCRHVISDCVSILSASGFTCSKQYFKSCSKMQIILMTISLISPVHYHNKFSLSIHLITI